jgi:hypothetical protein
MVVALFQLAFGTWIPMADAVYHSGDRPVSSSEGSGEFPEDGSVLAPTCFVCAAGLGAYAPGNPGPAPAGSMDLNFPVEELLGTLLCPLQVPSTLPRGPPSA